jgi:1,4-dihydroxy-6-naphthoate synthase
VDNGAVTDPIRIAHSPDSDDTFMFWALLHGEVDAEGLTFTAEAHDTETLNALADEGGTARAPYDVLAVSAARYATIADRWLLLPHGASVGRGYGPVVVAREPRVLATLAGKRVAVPGTRTTAYLVLRLLLDRFEPVVVPITPHDAVWRTLRSNEVDAALVIHEGRLTFEREGFALVCDVGAEWTAKHGLPLPLGVNVVRRALGEALVARVSRAIARSIAWALEHRDRLMVELGAGPLGADALDRYLAMYANADTEAMAPDVVRALSTLFSEAARHGWIEKAPTIELAP